jgi:D-alanyl-D-alanine carboxypeptidase/D-alanyl-D-alanine-endopeptidase (penicillin-binding protein 4)
VVAVAPRLLERPPGPAPGRAATPVFSVRRVPDLTTRVVASARLRADLEAVLAEPALRGATACLAVADPDGHPVLAHRADAPLIPASTIKLVTGLAALDRFGAGARYTTEVRAAAPPGADGAVGDLWLVGSGDPYLATADFAATAGWLESPRLHTSVEALADRIAAAGVRRVGRLVGDESRYDTQRYLPTWAPYFATNPEVGPQGALVVNDGFVEWRPREVAAPAPATHAAAVLAALLGDRGVAVGGVGQGRAPAQTVPVASVESPTMAEIVGQMVRDSENLAAELLVKELGARFGDGGTTAAGLAVVRAEVAALGPEAAAFSPADGSGLDRGNRLSCGLLQVVLARAGPDGDLARGLPEAGRSGTLVRRFLDTPAVGRVRAKTGSLEGVVGLSGWAEGLDGSRLRFSLVANGLPSEGVGAALQQRVAVAVAGWPRAPSPEEVAPRPPQPPAPPQPPGPRPG